MTQRLDARMRLVRRRGAPLLLGVLALVTVLAGCVPEPAPTPTAEPPASAPDPAPTHEPPVALVPDGTATDNLPIFTEVTERVWASEHRAEGRAYIDALVEAGFDKADMQVTEDTSTVGNPAESMQFSVLWKGECLVGQVGPDIGEAVTRVLGALENGTLCLLGNTRPIDW
ncbi:DUF6993 domain-containing protein [Microbacterium album]|uniref:DUF6993 domain-containing protein n=1 Tax=Microbacterium album TaxID=2053191 RepID=A0A917IEQ3_9MICO|nr:hypothetical protein [Microbacterium album]GGH39090.1 hypothetical protein GCM10010921_10110 [Microbacterium album]